MLQGVDLAWCEVQRRGVSLRIADQGDSRLDAPRHGLCGMTAAVMQHGTDGAIRQLTCAERLQDTYTGSASAQHRAAASQRSSGVAAVAVRCTDLATRTFDFHSDSPYPSVDRLLLSQWRFGYEQPSCCS
ncbi:hypothetical protein GCM10010492_70340 [Saccharothrix mutabilis subsp. mutabilis]|uniref:Uncharacterized protein n=1 Tax=Saccharothrix mutabilis subsp. mutabilis TaxID=66855 RepID=A0ABP3ECJ0_9PSEU